ncbi:hypothetical protein H4R33_003352 [Dimargaris cristalligena]|nr:hypothetical protein H4R33_003352 [Dimargaris cristalligena]
MITPRFEVTQDDQAVVVTIHAPHLRSQDIDIHIQDFQLRFFAKPYFLRLTFPGQVVEDDQSTAKYDIAQGELVLRVSKAEPGEHFPDLDLLSKLLATTTERKTQLSHGPLIEVVGETVTSEIPSTDDHLDPAHAQDHNGDEDDDDDDDEEEEAEYDWDLPQEIEPEVSATPALLNQARYGFENQHHGLFTHVQEMGNEINCLSSPETLSPEGRRRERIAQEEAKFDPDYYLSDLFDNDEIAELLAYQSPWKQCLREIRRQLRAGPVEPTAAAAVSTELDTQMAQLSLATSTPATSTGATTDPSKTSSTPAESSTLVQLTTATLPPLLASFTEAEQEQMRALPRKLLTVDAGMERSLYLGLVDLVFAYSYNLRTTLGESTVESVWTVGILSSLLAALDHHRPSLKAVAVASFRRALAYPLYRHWELCQAVWRDTQTIFKLGRRALVKVLLNLKDMFDHHDTYYVYSKIWFDDYCVWIQNGASDKKLQSLAKELDALVLTKLDLDWSLAELEAQALEVSSNDSSESDESDTTTDSDESEDDQEEESESVEAATSSPMLIPAASTGRPKIQFVDDVATETAPAVEEPLPAITSTPGDKPPTSAASSSALLDHNFSDKSLLNITSALTSDTPPFKPNRLE